MTMTLESIPGDLRAYAQLKPESMLHGYELTSERRTCSDKSLRNELRNNAFYTADGQLYTSKESGDVQWGITRLSQNLVLRHIDDAFTALTQTNNYFPPTDEARVSFEHPDTKVINLKGLKLVKNNGEYGHFVIDPKKVKQLNSQQKIAVVCLFGPDEESFGLNMEMLAEAEISPLISALMPDYVQHTLETKRKEYLGRASWLGYFVNNSSFGAIDRNVSIHARVRGVRREGEARSAAPENSGVPLVPVAPLEMTLADCYQRLLVNPTQAVKELTPERAAGISKLLADYLATR